jgi:hypothetical protein
MTYILSRHWRNKSGDQWTEFRGTRINDLPAAKASRKQSGDQWTEFCGTGINDLQTAEALRNQHRDQ